jgi:multisubunit Na+/H+ antiporter MnhB subunit
MKTELLELIARLLFLPMLVVSAAFLVKGYSAPGGGFAAGAIAGVAVLLQLVVFGARVTGALMSLRARITALVAGLTLALMVTLAGPLLGRPLLSHMPPPAGVVTHLGALELHTGLLFEAGVYLLVLAFVLEAVALVSPDVDPER